MTTPAPSPAPLPWHATEKGGPYSSPTFVRIVDAIETTLAVNTPQRRASAVDVGIVLVECFGIAPAPTSGPPPCAVCGEPREAHVQAGKGALLYEPPLASAPTTLDVLYARQGEELATAKRAVDVLREQNERLTRDKAAMQRLLDDTADLKRQANRERDELRAEVERLKSENARLRAIPSPAAVLEIMKPPPDTFRVKLGDPVCDSAGVEMGRVMAAAMGGGVVVKVSPVTTDTTRPDVVVGADPVRHLCGTGVYIVPGERCGCGFVWTWHEGRDDERNRWSETLCAEGNRHCMCPGCRATRIVDAFTSMLNTRSSGT